MERKMETAPNEVYKAPEADLSQEGEGADGLDNLKRVSARLVFFLGLITGGIYTIYWVYSRSVAINLTQKMKISSMLLNGLVVAFILASISSIGSIIVGSLAWSYFELGSNLVYFVLYLVVIFTIRSRLKSITNLPINVILTFFFSAIYFQYKINQKKIEIETTKGL